MKQSGSLAEKLACEYLQAQGLTLVTHNYYCKSGEIDLIMHDATYLIFIEVRYRQSNHFGGGLESITKQKQQKLIYTAAHYLQKYANKNHLPSRFDVVLLTGKATNMQIEWIKDAFQIS